MTFSSNDASATFECRLDGPGAAVGTYGPCTSPRILGSLADGAYTFMVRAIDAAGNVDATPASRSFTVDTTAPDTTITGGPTGTTNVATPSFTFTATEAGLDVRVQARRPGRDDGHVRELHLAAFATARWRTATYTFSVRATDAAGNVDATPATRTFTVETVGRRTRRSRRVRRV